MRLFPLMHTRFHVQTDALSCEFQIVNAIPFFSLPLSLSLAILSPSFLKYAVLIAVSFVFLILVFVISLALWLLDSGEIKCEEKKKNRNNPKVCNICRISLFLRITVTVCDAALAPSQYSQSVSVSPMACHCLATNQFMHAPNHVLYRPGFAILDRTCY